MEGELLVSGRQAMASLQAEYAAGNPVFVAKIVALGNSAAYYKTRGDGNCFYRGFAFAAFTRAALNPHLASRLRASPAVLHSAGFSALAYEDFLDTTLAVLALAVTDTDRDQLHAAFNDPESSNSVVVYLRFLTSATIKSNPLAYEPFLEGPLDRWCERNVEAIGAEADHLQINALVTALNIGVDIYYLDGTAGGEANVHQVRPEGEQEGKEEEEQEGGQKKIKKVDDVITLLYRPGHYDVLAL